MNSRLPPVDFYKRIAYEPRPHAVVSPDGLLRVTGRHSILEFDFEEDDSKQMVLIIARHESTHNGASEVIFERSLEVNSGTDVWAFCFNEYLSFRAWLGRPRDELDERQFAKMFELWTEAA